MKTTHTAILQKTIYFPTSQITWLEFKVLETNAINAGLIELKVYYTGKDISFSYNEPGSHELQPAAETLTLSSRQRERVRMRGTWTEVQYPVLDSILRTKL